MARAACNANSIGGPSAAGGGGGVGSGTAAVGCGTGRGTPLSPGRAISPGSSLPTESTDDAVRTAATHAVFEKALLPMHHLSMLMSLYFTLYNKSNLSFEPAGFDSYIILYYKVNDIVVKLETGDWQ
jgi:hypothetical protein